MAFDKTSTVTIVWSSVSLSSACLVKLVDTHAFFLLQIGPPDPPTGKLYGYMEQFFYQLNAIPVY